jgi:hypothetical protein
VSDELPPPPDTLVIGEFTIHLRQGVNRAWLAKIADRDGPRIMVRGQGRYCDPPGAGGGASERSQEAPAREGSSERNAASAR